MAGCHISTRRTIPRRSFLRDTGLLLALPLLESMSSAFAAPAVQAAARQRQMFAIRNNLGLPPDQFFPTGSGRDYKPSPCTGLFAAHREDFTILSGVSHHHVDGSARAGQ